MLEARIRSPLARDWCVNKVCWESIHPTKAMAGGVRSHCSVEALQAPTCGLFKVRHNLADKHVGIGDLECLMGEESCLGILHKVNDHSF